jgi:hypothetical protein
MRFTNDINIKNPPTRKKGSTGMVHTKGHDFKGARPMPHV